MRLFLSYIFLFCCLNGFGQIDEDSTLVDFGPYCYFKDIKGKLISVEIRYYGAEDRFGELKKITSFETEFINKGYFTLENRLSRVISEKDTIDIIYKNDSTTFQKTYIGSNYFGQVNSKFLWRYDKNRNNTEVTIFDNEIIKKRYLSKYNEQNKLIERKYYDKTGNLISLESFKYDKMGNQIESIKREKSYFNKIKMIYDDDNNLIEQLEMSEDENISLRDIIKYNAEGKKNSLITYDWKNVIFYKDTLTYDIYDRLIENSYFYEDWSSKISLKYHVNGQLFSVLKTNYDSNKIETQRLLKIFNNEGNLIEETEICNSHCLFNTKPSKRVTTYEYDQKGNWTKKTEYSVSPPTALPSKYHITERKINYR